MDAFEWIKSFLRVLPREFMVMDVESGSRNVKRWFESDWRSVSSLLGYSEVYYAVRSLEDYFTDRWDRLFFDFDAHNEQIDAIREHVLSFLSVLYLNGIEPFIVFTGRGYHVYVFLKHSVRLSIDSLRKQLMGMRFKYPSLDVSVLKDYPTSRLPYTVNTKAGRIAKPVDMNLEQVDYPEIPLNDVGVVASFFNGFDAGDTSSYIAVNRRVAVESIDDAPVCVRRMINSLIATGELDHLPRFALAVFLLRTVGFEGARRVFMMAGDYSEYVTSYQLKHIAERKYMYPSCTAIASMSFCDDKVKCPFKPWLEPYLREWSSKINNGVDDDAETGEGSNH
ncbi:MAG: hypothetical protein QXY20_07005 [Thermofilum sp.]|uniref:hypothetical protein n=1 Tax=Thermofilum sp. TaxID=1961369 RepID=UPI00316582D3